eukprot:8591784-Alexandrium_andersonii.AAC.1
MALAVLARSTQCTQGARVSGEPGDAWGAGAPLPTSRALAQAAYATRAWFTMLRTQLGRSARGCSCTALTCRGCRSST